MASKQASQQKLSNRTRSKVNSKIANAKATAASIICSICEDPIIEGTDECIQCDSHCGCWMHRKCSGLSVDAFATASTSSMPFHCSACRLRSSELEIADLKQTIKELCDVVNKLETKFSSSDILLENKSSVSGNKSGISYASAVGSSGVGSVVTDHQNQPSFPPNRLVRENDDRKFNVIVYGVEECPRGTARSDRFLNDINKVSDVFSSVDASIDSRAVKDLFRLGGFKSNMSRPRPILVKFVRCSDAHSILSKVRELSPPYSIKPDRSLSERKKDKCLMDIRWSLIQSGIARSLIKIRGVSLYVNNNLLGKADSTDTFVYEIGCDERTFAPVNSSQEQVTETALNNPQPNVSPTHRYSLSLQGAEDCTPSSQPSTIVTQVSAQPNYALSPLIPEPIDTLSHSTPPCSPLPSHQQGSSPGKSL